VKRGRYFTIPAVEAYPGVLTERLIRRLVAERRIAFTRAGRRVILAETDIEAYLDANRQEPYGRAAGRKPA
jgi:excisionase family DNA binding protein